MSFVVVALFGSLLGYSPQMGRFFVVEETCKRLSCSGACYGALSCSLLPFALKANHERTSWTDW